MKLPRVQSFAIPGSSATLLYERDADGRLVRLTCAGRVYVEQRGDERVFGGGLCAVAETVLPGGMLRRVRAGAKTWVEEYLVDGGGRLVKVDGVAIERDARGRIVACRGEGAAWRYAYAGERLAVIEGPHGVRMITPGEDGRPERARENGVAAEIDYDAHGGRTGVPAWPEAWSRDDAGRLWTVRDRAGRVAATFLWDGMACLGRIDGPPGDPLAAVFSLDPTLTPVRVIARDGTVTRIPRDAFGEALLDAATRAVPRDQAAPDREERDSHGCGRSASATVPVTARSDWHGQSPQGEDRGCHAVTGAARDPAIPGPFGGAMHEGFEERDSHGCGRSASATVPVTARSDWHGQSPQGEDRGCHAVPGAARVPAIPGLFGGAMHEGFVFLAARALDPRTGAFAARDPYHGELGDPRRDEGYDGPLLLDDPLSGPYAICRHDPLGRVDPLGTISVPMILSDLTWSLTHNLTGFLGLDGIINFWGSLFGGRAGRFFTGYGGLGGSDRNGTWGIKRDGILAQDDLVYGGRAWTYQHLVFIPRDHLDELDDVRVFAPDGAFRPTLYGTLLRVAPSSGRAFVLRGMAAPGGVTAPPELPAAWTRAGGTAEPVIPGSRVPRFPSGGLHFDQARPGLRGPLPAAITEVEPFGPVVTGTLEEQVRFAIPAGATLAAGDLVLLEDAARQAAALAVLAVTETAGARTATVENRAAHLQAANLRLRAIDAAAVVTEDLPRGTAPERLRLPAAAASPVAWAIGDAVGFADPGSGVVAPEVRHLASFAASLTLDAALDAAALPAPVDVFVADAPGPDVNAALTADPLVFRATPPASAPGQGTAVVVAAGAQRIAVMIASRDAATGDCRVDRALGGLGAAGTAVTVRALVERNPRLGRRETALDAGTTLALTADRARTAPTSGFVVVRASNAAAAARTVTAGEDEIVFDAPVPGAANPVRARRYPLRAGLDETIPLLSRTIALGLSAAAPQLADAVALQLGRVTAADLPAALAGGAALSAGYTPAADRLSATRAANPGGAQPTPGQPVIVNAGATRALALVTGVRAAITLTQNVTVRGTGLEIVPLARTGAFFAAAREDASRVVLGRRAFVFDTATNRFTLTGGARDTTTVPMARFAPGEIVRASWGDAAGAALTTAVYVVDAVERRENAGVVESEGARLTLRGGVPLPDPAPNLAIARLEPTNPANGGSRLGQDGRALDPATGAPAAGDAVVTDRVDALVTSPGAFAANQEIAIVSGDRVEAAVVSALGALTVVFGAALDAALGAGPVDLSAPALATSGFAAAIERDGDRLILVHDDPAPLRPAPNPVLVVAYRNAPDDAANAARRANGTLSGGTVLVPNDPDGPELSRKQSLIDHELTHTLQCGLYGPFLLAFFPLWALELTLELATDVEMPAYSPYVAGRLEAADDGSLRLSIPAPGSTTFAVDDEVQVAHAGTQTTITLAASPVAGQFRVPRDFPFAAGDAIQVRRKTASNGWTVTRDIIHNVLHGSTLGGVMNYLAGTVYGGLAFLIGRAFWFMGRHIFGMGDTFPADVTGADGDARRLLRLTNDAGRQALAQATRVLVQDGDRTIVRAVESVTDGTLRLAAALEGTAASVRVSPYQLRAPGDAWDWHNYYAARVPDADKPAAIQLDDAGLTLAPFDYVATSSGETSRRTLVTAVNGSVIELEEPPPTSGANREFRIAKIDERDPMGSADSRLLNEMGMGFLRWFWDPYGQLHLRTRPETGSVADVFGRIARYAFGAKSWSILPFFGVFFWGRLFPGDDVAYLSDMEQWASEESGDLYSPVGRLAGDLTFVGDIARYWFFSDQRNESFNFYTPMATGARQVSVARGGNAQRPHFESGDTVEIGYTDGAGTNQTARFVVQNVTFPAGAFEPVTLDLDGDLPNPMNGPSITGPRCRNYSTASLVTAGMGDAPGVWLADIVRSVPFVTAPAAPPAPPATPPEPNLGFATDPAQAATAALAVSDLFAAKSANRPAGTATNNPAGFAVGPRGFIPRSTQLERALGAYVAFSRPGAHRITVFDGLSGARQAREVQEKTKVLSDAPQQTIFFNRTVQPVTVRAAGRTVDDEATLTLLTRQRATVDVAPNGDRSYALAVARPVSGDVLRIDGERVLRAGRTGADEPAEVSRVHRFDTASARFSGALATHGLTLPEDVHVPVRGFTVRVVDAPPVLAELPAAIGTDDLYDPARAAAVALRPGGTVFVPVATAVVSWNGTAATPWPAPVYPAGPPEAVTHPVPAVPTPVADADLSEDMRAFRGDGTVFRIALDAADPPEEEAAIAFRAMIDPGSPIEVTAQIRLSPHFRLTSPAGLRIARGAALTLSCTDGVTPASVQVLPAENGVTATIAGNDVQIAVAAGATVGVRRIVVLAQGDGERRGRRTIEVT